MKWIVQRALATAAVATIAAGIALFFTAGFRQTVLDVYVLVLGAVVLLALIRFARGLRLAGSTSALDAAVRRGTTPGARESELFTLEREVELSQIDAFYFHVRMRPILREIAAHRLRMRYGVELDRDPARARELLPTALWDIVRADRRPPRDRLGRGPSIAEQRALVEELEKL